MNRINPGAPCRAARVIIISESSSDRASLFWHFPSKRVRPWNLPGVEPRVLFIRLFILEILSFLLSFLRSGKESPTFTDRKDETKDESRKRQVGQEKDGVTFCRRSRPLAGRTPNAIIGKNDPGVIHNAVDQC